MVDNIYVVGGKYFFNMLQIWNMSLCCGNLVVNGIKIAECTWEEYIKFREAWITISRGHCRKVLT